MVKRILLGLGGTPFSLVAVKRAVEMAKNHKACILAVTVVNEKSLRNVGPVPMGASGSAKKMADTRVEQTMAGIKKAIELFEIECAEAEICYKVIQENGNEFDCFIDNSRFYDIAIIGLRGLFDYGVMRAPENQVQRLFSEGLRPIIAVSETFRTIQKVLIAFSGSMDSSNAMKRFIQMHLWENMEIRILCCGKSEEEANILLEKAEDYCRDHGYPTEKFYRSGDPKKEILGFAKEWDADLIVMGDNSHNFLTKTFFSNNFVSAIKNAERPLFLSH